MSRLLTRAALLTVAVGLCTSLLACTQTQVPAELSQNLQGLKGEILRGRDCVRDATAALISLRDSRGASLKPPFDAYSQSLETLYSKAGGVGFVSEMSADKSEQYFKNWDEQVNSIAGKDLRAAGAERREQAMAEYAKLRELDAQLRVAFRPYMSRLVDIKTALSMDLTAQGREKALPTINKAIDGEAEILSRVDALVHQIDAMSGR